MSWLNKVIDNIQKQDCSETCVVRIKNGQEFPANLEDIYYNQACFIIASGPSFKNVNTELFDTPGIMTMGLNNSIKNYRSNLWISMDSPRRFLQSIWEDPRIMKFCGTGKWKDNIWDYKKWEEAGFPETNDFKHIKKVQDCPNVYHIKRNTKFEAEEYLDEYSVNWGCHKNYGGGRSVLMAAIKLCYILGFRRIYLNGVDFKMSSDYAYHFEEKRHNGAVNNNNNTYRRMISYFTQLIPKFEEKGYKIYNCTKGSALNLFPYVELEEAIKTEISHFPNPKEEKTENMYTSGR